jgi:membrane protein YqaA with SNARE-associated domain
MKLQDYLLKKADSAAALWLVFFGTLCDSIFLFIPPEVFMTPPIVANKKRAAGAVIAATIGSLVGAIIAYAIGVWLYDSIGAWIINTFSSAEQFNIAREMFITHGLLIILIAAFTPVPFKLLTICAGFLGFSPALYLGITAIGRALRFAVMGFLLWRFQEHANKIVRKYFWPLLLVAILAACFGLGLMYFV